MSELSIYRCLRRFFCAFKNSEWMWHRVTPQSSSISKLKAPATSSFLCHFTQIAQARHIVSSLSYLCLPLPRDLAQNCVRTSMLKVWHSCWDPLCVTAIFGNVSQACLQQTREWIARRHRRSCPLFLVNLDSIWCKPNSHPKILKKFAKTAPHWRKFTQDGTHYSSPKLKSLNSSLTR